MNTDVIIVGAGPTGLSLAAQLMRYNIDFVIFDKKEGTTELSKALVVHARTLEIYDQLGLAQKAVKGGEIVYEGTILHDGKITAQIDFSNFGVHLSPFSFMLAFEQSKNEHLLYDYLQRGGKEVLWQTELENLTQDADGVKAIIKNSDGETQEIEAKYLVGCDGAGSPTRHLLNLEFEGSTYPRLFYVADVQMEFEAKEAAFYAALGEDSFALIVPLKGDKRWRLIGNLPEYDEKTNPEVSFESVENKFKELVQRPLEITKVNWFSSYKVPTRRVENFASGRCFLAGDAAHVHTPAGGQGMNTGIQDAYNLAWKMAFVLKGSAQESLLETYNEERLENAKNLLASTDRLFDFAASEKWYFQFFRDHILPPLANIVAHFDAAKELLFPLVSQIAVNYRDELLSSHQSDGDFDVKAGDRMPYFIADGASVYDKLREPKFHSIVFSDGTKDYKNLQSELENAHGEVVDFHIIPLYPHVAEIFGTDKSFAVLLRPDNYIGLLSKDVSISEIQNYLTNFVNIR